MRARKLWVVAPSGSYKPKTIPKPARPCPNPPKFNPTTYLNPTHTLPVPGQAESFSDPCPASLPASSTRQHLWRNPQPARFSPKALQFPLQPAQFPLWTCRNPTSPHQKIHLVRPPPSPVSPPAPQALLLRKRGRGAQNQAPRPARRHPMRGGKSRLDNFIQTDHFRAESACNLLKPLQNRREPCRDPAAAAPLGVISGAERASGSPPARSPPRR